MTVTISPSIPNCNIMNPRAELERTSGTDVTHVDVMDNCFAPNLSWSLPMAEAVVKSRILPVSTHLMIENPDRWASAYTEAGCSSVIFHAKAAHASLRPARELHHLGPKIGLGLKLATDAAPSVDILSKFDMIFVITVKPGFGGQSFIDSTVPRIRRTRRATNVSDLEVSTQIDDGASRKMIGLTAEVGMDNFVADSVVFKAEDAHAEVEAL